MPLFIRLMLEGKDDNVCQSLHAFCSFCMSVFCLFVCVCLFVSVSLSVKCVPPILLYWVAVIICIILAPLYCFCSLGSGPK